MTNPQELYGKPRISVHYTTIDRATFENGSIGLAGGQGTVSREPNLSVMVDAVSGRSNTVTIPYADAIRLIIDAGNRHERSTAVEPGRSVPSLDGLPVMVLYDGANPVSIGLVSEAAQAIAGTYAGEAREQLGAAARTGLKAAKKGLGMAVGALADMLREEPKK